MQPEEHQDVREAFDSLKAFRPTCVEANRTSVHAAYRLQQELLRRAQNVTTWKTGGVLTSPA